MRGISTNLLMMAVAASILIVIGILFFNETRRVSEGTTLFERMDERTDIIVSDMVPVGCFIPPDSDEEFYEQLKADEELKEACLRYDEGWSLPSDDSNFLKWDDIEPSLAGGIKLDGYCMESAWDTCLGLTEELEYAAKDECEIADEAIRAARRSIDFGHSEEAGFGKGIEKKSYEWSGTTPSVFVMNPRAPARLSLYAGVKVKGSKTVEKITAALYSGTYSEENCISNVVGLGSCYSNKNFGCFGTKSASECGCSEDLRYYDEEPLELCKNLAEENSEMQAGCDYGSQILTLKNCLLDEKDNCYDICTVPDCEGSFKSEKDFREPCEKFMGDQKSGCGKFFDFEKAVFRIEPPNYTIVKLGEVVIDRLLEGSAYRGMAYASANLTVRVKSPGKSCYDPEIYPEYQFCCEELCRKEGDAGDKPDCLLDTTVPCSASDDLSRVGEPDGPKCIKPGTGAYVCSIEASLEDDDRYVLCRNFCQSPDGYYGDAEKIEECAWGCRAAEDMEEKYGHIEGINKVDLVFIVDSSSSMEDERRELDAIMENLRVAVMEENLDLEMSRYDLGGYSLRGNRLPCRNTISYGAICTEPRGSSFVDLENWGPGAQWVIDNRPWRDGALKLLFVVADEGPVGGGSESAGECDTGSCDPKEPETCPDMSSEYNPDRNDCLYYNSRKNCESVSTAAQMAKAEDIIIYGLWGDDSGVDDLPSALKDMFRAISEPTGGGAYYFTDEEEVTELIKDKIILSRGDEFNRGYDKYKALSENVAPLDDPYIYKEAYEQVYSNLIYIVDWNEGSTSCMSGWCYPAGGSDWTKMKGTETTPNPADPENPSTETYGKPIKANFIDKIRNIYEDG
ncbi:MAG: hypothetical protein ACP5E4_00235 [Candidatus Aenigmatarchaeota archaeon]